MANEEIRNEEELQEFETFMYEINGEEKEWAIMDTFEFEGKNYIVCAEVVGEEILEDGLYILEGNEDGDDIVISNIPTEEMYDRVVEEYCRLCDEAAEQ